MSTRAEHRMLYDFNMKDDFLRETFEEVSPYTFYETLFSDKDLYTDYCIVTFGYDGDLELCEHNPIQKTIKKMTFEDAIETSEKYANMYIPPCTFFGNHNSAKCMENLYAIIVDFDGDKNGVSIPMIKWLAERIQDTEEHILPPSFITNSGNGLHLIWVFNKPVPMFNQNKKYMKELYSKIHQLLIAYHSNPQVHHFGQAYRIVGSKTKINTITTAYRSGGTYDADYLMKYFEVEGSLVWKEGVDRHTLPPSEPMLKLAENIENSLGLVCENKESWQSVRDFIQENRMDFDIYCQMNKSKSNRFHKAEGNGWGSVDWYKRMKKAIIEKTPEGYRYTSLMAFMVIGYKCNVPFEQVKKDEDEIILMWQLRPKPFSHRFNDKYRDRVDDCYSDKYKRVSKVQLEKWLGFEMHSSTRRNGQTQKNHLEEARAIRDIRQKRNGTNWRDGNGRKSKKDIVVQWREEHPNGKKVECIRDTGLGKTTVNKWWNGEPNKSGFEVADATFVKNDVPKVEKQPKNTVPHAIQIMPEAIKDAQSGLEYDEIIKKYGLSALDKDDLELMNTLKFFIKARQQLKLDK